MGQVDRGSRCVAEKKKESLSLILVRIQPIINAAWENHTFEHLAFQLARQINSMFIR